MRIIDLDGPDGNAFFLLGQAQSWAKQLGYDYKSIIEEMKSGDYTNLCQTFHKHFKNVAQLETSNEDLVRAIYDC
jgi:hypothetical protein